MLAIEMIVPGKEKKPDPAANMTVLQEALKRGLIGYMAGNTGNVLRYSPLM